jgi:hypothetical protein
MVKFTSYLAKTLDTRCIPAAKRLGAPLPGAPGVATMKCAG